MQYKDIFLDRLRHNCFRIKGKKTTVFTDPYMIQKEYHEADVVLITHDHYDHLELQSIKKVIKDTGVIVAPQNCSDKFDGIKNKLVLVKPNEFKIVGDVPIKTVHSYNTNKFKTKNEVFHPKEYGNVGYVFIVDDVRIYIAGDTDLIPEMADVKVDIALLPISGIYVMTAEEGAEAAIKIKADLTIPAHYGSGIGTEEDARRFKNLLKGKINVDILNSID